MSHEVLSAAQFCGTYYAKVAKLMAKEAAKKVKNETMAWAEGMGVVPTSKVVAYARKGTNGDRN